MSISVRKPVAVLVLALSLIGGGLALMANTSMLSPTADGGQPAIVPGGTTTKEN
jgi:hypothetical protein